MRRRCTMLRPWFCTYTSALVPDFTMETTTVLADWKLVSHGLQGMLISCGWVRGPGVDGVAFRGTEATAFWWEPLGRRAGNGAGTTPNRARSGPATASGGTGGGKSCGEKRLHLVAENRCRPARGVPAAPPGAPLSPPGRRGRRGY